MYEFTENLFKIPKFWIYIHALFLGLFQTNTNTTKSSSGSHQNAYEKVVYNAATTFLTQQAQTSKPSWQKNEKPTFKLQNQKGNWQNRNSAGAKPQQLHYCEVCKISCAGPQVRIIIVLREWSGNIMYNWLKSQAAFLSWC